ncbi:hypothetical protein QJS66_16775 [Kocuria rhizophila]|nr:hypothetical protein QJS66_16775 [Kocuria rhizophila]
METGARLPSGGSVAAGGGARCADRPGGPPGPWHPQPHPAEPGGWLLGWAAGVVLGKPAPRTRPPAHLLNREYLVDLPALDWAAHPCGLGAVPQGWGYQLLIAGRRAASSCRSAPAPWPRRGARTVRGLRGSAPAPPRAGSTCPRAPARTARRPARSGTSISRALPRHVERFMVGG